MPPKVRAAVQKISYGLFDLLFPDNCRLCDRALTEVTRVPICAECLAKPEPLAAEYYCTTCRAPFSSAFPLDANGRCALCRHGFHGFDEAYTFGFYDGVLRELIQTFKYGGIPTLARPLGQLLSRALPRDAGFDVIVPMPMHWRRRLQRGYNQADLLAKELAVHTGLPVRRLVKRSKATAPQAGLTGAKRRANVTAAFRVKQRDRVAGLRVLLVDDVLTTGATAGACARELKRAGAKGVTVLTVARADRRMWTETGSTKIVAGFSFQPTGSLADGKSGSFA